LRISPVITASAVLCTALLGSIQTAEAQGSSELAGAWIVTSWASADGDVNSEPQRGLFVFTESGNYSMMYVNTEEPRALYTGGSQTDAETVAAYNGFTANSGRYRVSGHEITYEAYMAKDVNYMSGFMTEEGNAVTVDFGIEDGTLTLHWASGPGGVAGARTATLRRPGGN